MELVEKRLYRHPYWRRIFMSIQDLDSDLVLLCLDIKWYSRKLKRWFSAFDNMKQEVCSLRFWRVGEWWKHHYETPLLCMAGRANHAGHYSRSPCCHSNTPWNFTLTLDWWFRLKKGLSRLPRRCVTLSSAWITWVMPANYGGRRRVTAAKQRRRRSPTAANASGSCCSMRSGNSIS